MKTGDTIGKYRLVSRLGRGGMGEVWLANAAGYAGFTKTVVLKTLLPELASDPLFVELLAREAKTCSKLSHPNLIEVFDFTKQDDVYLLAMEHVLGQPLNSIMRAAHARGETLPPWFVLRVAWECCNGVQYAHDQGVIHCDLSPSNVMVTYTGATKVLDFGVAHAKALGPRSDRLKGKYSYMAPERIKTRATDPRTDIYALGVLLYLVFTGQLPFVGESDAELLRKITHEKLVAPSAYAPIAPWIEEVILRAMHPDPRRRYQSMTEVLEALAPCLEGHLGTYGQQHVAAFVSALFGRQLPVVPPPVELDVEEIEIDLETAPHAIPPALVHDASTAPLRAPPPPPLPPPPPPRDRRALGSDPMPALARADAPGMPDKPHKPATMPLISAFAQASTPLEPRTSVQSLFGERPSQPTPVAGLFARGTRDELPDLPPEPVAEPEPFRSDPEPGGPEPDPRDRDRSRGAFGAYSIRRVAPEVVWPWPTSRTKSE
jgi:hypothetical protein